jgi:hypothetical protein
MAQEVTHLTLNTGNLFVVVGEPLFGDCHQKGELPEPFDRFAIETVFKGKGWQYFDLSLDGEHVTANMVCWQESDGCWEKLTSLYLQIYDSPSQVSATPPQPPWLATVVLPNSAIENSQLIAQVEQSIALNAILAAKLE